MKQSSIWYELETKGEYLMERTIVVANQKGGVGKTTTAINLAASLAELGKKVLVVDMDPQGNTTSGLGIDKEQAENTVYELMLEECSVEDAIMESEYENLSVLPSNINLAAAEIELVGAEEKEYILKKAIDKVKKNYDFVLIDCMPSLGMITINSLAASDSVVIPTQPHYLSAKGLELLLRTVSKVRRQINPRLRIDGILMTMVMPRTNISKDIISSVKSAYGQKIRVFDTQIPHSVRAVEATAEGKSIFAYDKGGKVAAAYEQFAKEVVEIGEKQRKQNRADRLR